MNISNNNNNKLAQLETNLRGALAAYADEVMPVTDNPDYRMALCSLFVEEGADFLIACMRKFAAGQVKYGGNFFQADHARESRAEHIDLFNYNAGASMARKYPALLNLIETSEGQGE